MMFEMIRLSSRLLGAVVSTSLIGAALNVGISALSRPGTLQEFSGYLAIWLFTGFVLAVSQVVIWLAIRPLLLRGILQATPSTIGIAVFTTGVCVLAPILLTYSLHSSPAEKLIAYLLLALGLIATTITTYITTLSLLADQPTDRFAASFSLMGSLLAIAIAFFAWFQIFVVQGKLSLRSLVVTALLIIVLALLGKFAPRIVKDKNARQINLLHISLLAALTLLLIVLKSGAPTQRPTAASLEEEAPNVVLLTVDTLRSDLLRPYGSATTIMPTLDALCENGILFRNARSAAPWTRPAMASIMTGLPPLTHRVLTRKSKLPERARSIAEVLSEAGYTTAAIGSNPALRSEFNFDQGFKEYRFFPRDSSGSSLGGLLLDHLRRDTDPDTSELADMAIDWISRHNDQKFFLWLHILDPHMPLIPPEDYVNQNHALRQTGVLFSQTTPIRSGDHSPTSSDRESLKELYKLEARYVDDNIRRVLDSLKNRGLYEESLIVIASDHGEEFWDHGGFTHGHTLYDELLRVPLCLKLPWTSEAIQIENSVSTEDIAPTIIELARVRESDQPAEHSLSRFWRSSNNTPSVEPIFSTATRFYGDQVSVVFDDMKYIKNIYSGEIMLFDLKSDPMEKESVAENFPDIVAQAEALIEEYLSSSVKQSQALGLSDEVLSGDLSPELAAKLRALGYVN